MYMKNSTECRSEPEELRTKTNCCPISESKIWNLLFFLLTVCLTNKKTCFSVSKVSKFTSGWQTGSHKVWPCCLAEAQITWSYLEPVVYQSKLMCNSLAFEKRGHKFTHNHLYVYLQLSFFILNLQGVTVFIWIKCGKVSNEDTPHNLQ